MLDGLFTTPVYSRIRDRFVNSAFPNKKHLAPKIEVYLWQTNLKANVCRNSTFQVNRKKNATGRRRLTSSNRRAAIFLFFQHFMRRTTQQTFLTINLASQQKTTKLYFSSQVRKEFKLWKVPFKPLRCCLRSDKLVNCHVWKLCKDLFWNFCVIWSVNQIVPFNGFLSDFVSITSCVYSKTIILFNLCELWLKEYLPRRFATPLKQPLFASISKNNC